LIFIGDFHKEGKTHLSSQLLFLIRMEGKMKKFLFILFVFIFASSASAAVYKWVDERGFVNFADDYSKVPPDYRDKVEEVSITKIGPSTSSQTSPRNIEAGAKSGNTATQAPPIAQPLIREGDFAIKLAEALKIGQANSEAEAESMLASVGIAPDNGWIDDYPVTPDVLGELEKAIGEAADAKRLPMGKNEALKAFRTTAVELELPVITEVPDRYAESPSPTIPQYTEPSVIDNYYDTEGPPVVTYYPPPPAYYYLYAWIPSPFWFSGFYFPGFYMLHDFHRVVFINRHACTITNHIRDHRTGRIFTIHPERRHEGRTFGRGDHPHRRGFNSMEARNGARSIYERSRERNPAYSRSGQGSERQVYNRGSNPSGLNGRNNQYRRPPIADRRMSRSSHGNGFHGMNERTFSRPDSMKRNNRMNFQRPSAGETRSFSPPAWGSGRSFSPPPQRGGQRFNPSHTGSKGFSGSHQGVGRGSGLRQGNTRF
jgi:hypothetical protein